MKKMNVKSKNNTMIFFWCIISFIGLVISTNPPNIVFILADDLGWFDVGFHGMTDIPTPNLDSLAKRSVILNNYYVERLCTPSRGALLTSLYSSRTGLQHSVIYTGAPYGLPINIKTLQQSMKEINYVTRMVGKWHLGFHETKFTPTLRGFDSFYGFWTGVNDYFSHLCASQVTSESLNVPSLVPWTSLNLSGKTLRDNLTPVENRSGEYLTHILNHEALKIIKTHNQTKPLFLYLAHHAVHRGNPQLPVTGPKGTNERFKYIKNNARRNFAGVLEALDDSVGDIMIALQETGMLNNTIVIFSSDNGASLTVPYPTGGSNYPLRGQKYGVFEGGVKAIGMIWYPSLIEPRISNQLMHITDWFPTLYRIGGGDPNTLGDIDGIDMWDVINSDGLSPRQEILLGLDSITGLGSIRVGDFKLINGTSEVNDSDNWFETPGYIPRKINKTDHSKVSNVLNKFYENGTGRLRRNKIPMEIDCDLEKGSNSCDPIRSPCLYNIAADPCEKNNLAQEKPDILDKLLLRLEYHKTKQVTPLYKFTDYLSNPEFFGGFWSPWLDELQITPDYSMSYKLEE